MVNLLELREGERISNCLAIREFDDDHFLLMATRSGIVKKTVLSAYSRPMKGGIIAINLDDEDDLIDVRIVAEDDDVLLCSSQGRTIRFAQSDARSMGRATRGVRGISIPANDAVVGMVVADPAKSLLIVCENGYGKRTIIGPGALDDGEQDIVEGDVEDAGTVAAPAPETDLVDADGGSDDQGAEDEDASALARLTFRRQRRGGKGLRGIKTTQRNGDVVDILAVSDEDEVLMVTAGGKIQRIRACDISQIGRDTQGVRVIRLDEDDTLVSCAAIAGDQIEVADEAADDVATPDASADTDTPASEVESVPDATEDDPNDAQS